MQNETITLSTAPQQHRQALVELRTRLLAGEPYWTEQVLDGFPDLRQNPNAVLELIRAEWLLRHHRGEILERDAFLNRFPAWRAELASWLDELVLEQSSTREAPRRGKAVFDADASSPPSLDDHTLDAVLGVGGMGIVHRAWDPALKRQVAMKKLRAGTLADAVEIARFYREAQAAARLHHPNIVPIHAIGLHQGEHCFTMGLVTGGNLTQHRKYFTERPREAVELMSKVAWAVHAAHSQGIIHRDLKPQNILLDEQRQPQVADFGLARVCERDEDFTLPGQLLGTPAYMSPEQASGKTWEVGVRSDIWSLGVILYELLTGQRPFTGESSEKVRQQVLETTPVAPRRVNPALDASLEAVILRCLQRRSALRYQEAKELAEELDRWLQQGRTRALRQQRQARARRLALSAACLGLLLLAAVAGWSKMAPVDPGEPGDPVAEELEKQLATGKSVTLVGAEGPPAWHRFRSGSATWMDLQIPTRPFCTLATIDFCQCALLRSAPEPEFRFEAELCLEDSYQEAGQAGIFALASKRATSRGAEEVALVLEFHEQFVPDMHQGPEKPHTVVEVVLWRHLPGVFDNRISLATSKQIPHPVNRSHRNMLWHHLSLETRSDRVVLSFDREPFAEVTRETMHRCFRETMKIPTSYSVDAHILPELPMNGPLGVWARRGRVFFRNVVVSPTPDRANSKEPRP